MKLYNNSFWALLFCATLFSCQSKKENPTESDLVSNEKHTPLTKKDATVKIDTEISENVSEKSMFVYGIDISKYQGNEIDFLNIKTDSLGFVICKATEGITYTDPNFTHNWTTISENKFIRGAYHFYRCNDDPIAQAKNYLSAIANLKNTDFPPIIDFEEGGIDESQSVEQIQSSLLIFINEIEKKIKRKPIIYTDVNTGNKYLNKSVFSNYPLWIANYNNKKQPDLPTTWENSKWILWQKSASYKIGSTTNDFDIFNGSLSNLQKFIKATDTL
ncbi:MAG: hypothetical protein COA88_13135 [Kordia sp.]|nr:MAG: hypothetical protein COA88_13135 [Kordia sp.]